MYISIWNRENPVTENDLISKRKGKTNIYIIKQILITKKTPIKSKTNMFSKTVYTNS